MEVDETCSSSDSDTRVSTLPILRVIARESIAVTAVHVLVFWSSSYDKEDITGHDRSPTSRVSGREIVVIVAVDLLVVASCASKCLVSLFSCEKLPRRGINRRIYRSSRKEWSRRCGVLSVKPIPSSSRCRSIRRPSVKNASKRWVCTFVLVNNQHCGPATSDMKVYLSLIDDRVSPPPLPLSLSNVNME